MIDWQLDFVSLSLTLSQIHNPAGFGIWSRSNDARMFHLHNTQDSELILTEFFAVGECEEEQATPVPPVFA